MGAGAPPRSRGGRPPGREVGEFPTPGSGCRLAGLALPLPRPGSPLGGSSPTPQAPGARTQGTWRCPPPQVSRPAPRRRSALVASDYNSRLAPRAPAAAPRASGTWSPGRGAAAASGRRRESGRRCGRAEPGMASAGGGDCEAAAPEADRPHQRPFLIGVSGGTASGKVRGRRGRRDPRPSGPRADGPASSRAGAAGGGLRPWRRAAGGGRGRCPRPPASPRASPLRASAGASRAAAGAGGSGRRPAPGRRSRARRESRVFPVHRVREDHGAAGPERSGPPAAEAGHPESRQVLQGPDPRTEGQGVEGTVQFRPPRCSRGP